MCCHRATLPARQDRVLPWLGCPHLTCKGTLQKKSERMKIQVIWRLPDSKGKTSLDSPFLPKLERSSNFVCSTGNGMDCSVTPPVTLASETENCEGNPSQTPGLHMPKACKGETEKMHLRGERWQPNMCSVCSCHRNETSACVSQPIKQPSHKHALINSYEPLYRRGGGCTYVCLMERKTPSISMHSINTQLISRTPQPSVL